MKMIMTIKIQLNHQREIIMDHSIFLQGTSKKTTYALTDKSLNLQRHVEKMQNIKKEGQHLTVACSC